MGPARRCGSACRRITISGWPVSDRLKFGGSRWQSSLPHSGCGTVGPNIHFASLGDARREVERGRASEIEKGYLIRGTPFWYRGFARIASNTSGAIGGSARLASHDGMTPYAATKWIGNSAAGGREWSGARDATLMDLQTRVGISQVVAAITAIGGTVFAVLQQAGPEAEQAATLPLRPTSDGTTAAPGPRPVRACPAPRTDGLRPERSRAALRIAGAATPAR